jgi:DNA invertase Pin-like site-specific DNA recombinase
MVAKLDRLSRSVHDATGLLLRADRAGWGLIALGGR